MRSWTTRAVWAALLSGLLLAIGAPAAAAAVPGFDWTLPHTTGAPGAPFDRATASSSHHGPTEGHLPATQQELELVGRLELTGAFGDVQPGQIADLAVHKGYAYLNSWDNPNCQRGGTYIVDIRNPAQPREVGFIPAQFPYYHGEGAHVVSINTPAFQGDVLAVNNETYGSNLALNNDCGLAEPPDTTFGGFDLYDVTNPENPVPLVVAAGDREDDDNPGSPLLPAPFSYHSVFVWQDGPRAFLVATDNIEEPDVDIFDITNPGVPVQVGDFDLDVMFPQILDGEDALGQTVLHHDVVVKHIDGRPVMKSDYWDAGYVQLDVSDPSNPTLITDTTFGGEDPLLPGTGITPEGNAHQGEFSFDNQFLLAADEDFGTHRLQQLIGGVEADPPFGFGVPVRPDGSAIEDLLIQVDEPLASDTRFIGLGCDPLTIPPPTPGVAIAVAERGVCGFEVKALNAENAGYEGFVIFNSNAAGTGCETLLNMQFSDPTPVTIKGIFVGRRDGFRILGVLDPTYTCTQGGATTPAPPVPTEGETLELSALFDGWGYAHLYDAKTSAHLDAFAIPEAHDERFASGFGDLTIHEFATDPTESIAYSSYYSAGMRVLRYSRANGLEQAGAWIAPEGSNFWGVEQFTTPQGGRLIAGSDRDFGLVILRYTGPDAAQPPACTNVTVMVPFKQSANVPLTCSDPNGNPLRESTTSAPTGGTLSGNPDSGSVTYTHTGDRIGPAGSFGFKANDGAADSNTATASMVAVARNGGRCFNPFVGSARRDVIVGSRFGDRIRGARGRDQIEARAGADCVSGGGGADRLAGQKGRDRVSGGAKKDRLSGGDGRDRLAGNAGNDRLAGNAGNDRLTGGGGRNRYLGGTGNDRIFARNGKADRIGCGRGRDRVRADAKDRVAGDCENVRR